jgi:hypothetical protein
MGRYKDKGSKVRLCTVYLIYVLIFVVIMVLSSEVVRKWQSMAILLTVSTL